MVIGHNVTFKKGVVLFEDNNCQINIGEGTTIEDAQFAVAEEKRELVMRLV